MTLNRLLQSRVLPGEHYKPELRVVDEGDGPVSSVRAEEGTGSAETETREIRELQE